MAEEDKTDKKRKSRDEKGRFVEGNEGGGHPLGVPNYRANFRKKLESFSTWKAPDAIILQIRNALPKITNQATIDDIEAARIHLAAMMGESWALDRLHGKPDQAIDVTTNGEDINKNIDSELLSMLSQIVKTEKEKNDNDVTPESAA